MADLAITLDAEAAAPNHPEGETTEEKKQPEAVAEVEQPAQESTVESDPFDFIEQNDAGEYVIKTEHSVLKGQTKEEVIRKMRDELLEKERYTRELKTKASLKHPSEIVVKQLKEEITEEPKIQLRSRNEILQEVAPKVITKYGIDPKKLAWDDSRWQDYAREEGIEPIILMRQMSVYDKAKDEINNLADAIYADETRRAAIAEITDQEHESVVALVAESGIDAKDFNYEAVLERALGKKEHYDSDGVLKSGVIVREAAKEINRILSEKAKSPVRKKLEEAIAGSMEKPKVPSDTVKATSRGNVKPPQQVYRDFDEIVEVIKQRYS